MRANEFITEAKLVDYEGLTLKITKNDYELMVDALDDWGNKVLGHVTFYIGDDKELDPQDLWVNEKYQRQGIAKTMYDYVKKLGYTIVRSYDQTDAGSAFWDKHRGDVRVWEAFDKPYKGKWEKSDYGDIDVNAKLPDGTYLNIMFNQEYDGEGEEVIQVEFHRNNSQEVTGEGDAQRIFATVLDAIQKYIKKYKPQRLSFSASKSVDMDADDVEHFNPESRAKLYTRLVQRYAGAWGYQAQVDDNGDVVIYQLTRSMAENNTAAGINKMFNNLGDPVFANLQRVALLAMQGRQSEAASRLHTVIKDADPAVQKKITDAVNNIKPVTINGRVADSSTLDKSKQHNDWIINTFIPWVQSLLGQPVAENFHDGKNPGRKGLAKRMGVNTKASVSSLRKTAKNSSGEKQRMAHWLANMKAGRAKKH